MAPISRLAHMNRHPEAVVTLGRVPCNLRLLKDWPYALRGLEVKTGNDL
jgi:hypothetical protein